MTALVISELTEKSLDGNGSFDVLMAAAVPHLDKEFTKGRIKGPEYSEVYLSLLQNVMQTALAFVLQKRKNDLEAQLLDKQILLADKQLEIADKDIELKDKEIELKDKQILLMTSDIALKAQQVINAATENTVLIAQECKLRAEFDLTMANVTKSAQETLLLTQKVATEKAQTQSIGVDADSVVGKQKALYAAQTKGFTDDAIQKAVKLMVDSWNVRRTTDEGTVADTTNKLDDASVGAFVQKMKDSLGV